ncbi:hypothetical protein J3Q64DRAFT_1809666 [Phycomyces blakesleeanus]|uniref:Enoyl reductase (ER) domain-containing protein n=2 Tax=Phycomyces blakesleeanus TaxID=4837 RepID=A0A167MPK4_PHYB8|nr:hypothetical protein PHYBLDRAFT_168810 [Phycomyces blakesleeanus NRRL 1555(-)]OAD73456.1 hypothetical protein PHYBLDRAFT_168810 [Phycomyces blakesleeanus NRRL 1555(-)]|eukprot:XP_018291496.1 hypothetical protein PHYBLDRAFT_168810 [Phycomyces blakesleeanus NRRL 1555(-)]
MTSNTQVIYVKPPKEYPIIGETMKIAKSTIDLDCALSQGDIIIKNLVLSVDPYMRGRMRDPSIESYAPAFEFNSVMTGDTMSVVIKSNNPKFKQGDLVYGKTGLGYFEEYSHVKGAYADIGYVVRNDPKTTGLPLTYYVGVLGMPGLTAYVGLQKYGKPKKGETLYVSAASGAVGQIVGQIGKALGLHVVGSAGSDEKVAYLKELGFDGAFNYKTQSIDEKLKELCPKGIDIYYESVGGEMLEHVLNHANNFGRIVVCGMISQYNTSNPYPIRNIIYVLTKRLTMSGFIVMDKENIAYEEEFMRTCTQWLLEGKIKYRETVAEGIENTPQALLDVLKGKNFGKQVVKIADL